MDWTDDGIVLAARRHGETSAVVPTQMIRGSFCENTAAPIEPAPYLSKIAFQVVPAFLDRNTPPEADATSTVR